VRSGNRRSLQLSSGEHQRVGDLRGSVAWLPKYIHARLPSRELIHLSRPAAPKIDPRFGEGRFLEGLLKPLRPVEQRLGSGNRPR